MVSLLSAQDVPLFCELPVGPGKPLELRFPKKRKAEGGQESGRVPWRGDGRPGEGRTPGRGDGRGDRCLGEGMGAREKDGRPGEGRAPGRGDGHLGEGRTPTTTQQRGQTLVTAQLWMPHRVP